MATSRPLTYRLRCAALGASSTPKEKLGLGAEEDRFYCPDVYLPRSKASPAASLHRPAGSVWVAAYMYRVSRLIVLGVRRRIRHQPFAGMPRPWGASEKVHTLIDFVAQTGKLRWEQRLGKWSNEHPEWKYDNVNSMRAVYYRAVAKARRPASRLKGRKAAK